MVKGFSIHFGTKLIDSHANLPPVINHFIFTSVAQIMSWLPISHNLSTISGVPLYATSAISFTAIQDGHSRRIHYNIADS
jgi:hypothetical protein